MSVGVRRSFTIMSVRSAIVVHSPTRLAPSAASARFSAKMAMILSTPVADRERMAWKPWLVGRGADVLGESEVLADEVDRLDAERVERWHRSGRAPCVEICGHTSRGS